MNILLFLLLLESTQLSKPEQLVEDFYSWYVNEGFKEVKPTFAELDNGFTTLDFTNYDEHLRRFQFSEQLIKDSKNIYEPCITNLSTVKFSDFQQFEDLDQFEEINCSFQFYHWFGSGMESFQHFELTETKKLNNKKYELTVGLAYQTGKQPTLFIPVTVELLNSNWQITNVKTE